jgi:hypothetical protein
MRRLSDSSYKSIMSLTVIVLKHDAKNKNVEAANAELARSAWRGASICGAAPAKTAARACLCSKAAMAAADRAEARLRLKST